MRISILLCAGLMFLSCVHIIVEKRIPECRVASSGTVGFSLENDKVAFQVYGPALEGPGKDAQLGCTIERDSYPMIDRGQKGAAFRGGDSLGCGGLGLWKDGKILAPNRFKDVEILQGGTNRTEVVLKYEWTNQGITGVKRISLEPGSHLFRVESSFFKAGNPVQVDLAIGLTPHDGKVVTRVDDFYPLISSWEAGDNSAVGTAVLLDEALNARYLEIESSDGKRSHAVFAVSTNTKGNVSYYAGYGQKNEPDFPQSGAWEKYLYEFARNVASRRVVYGAEAVKKTAKRVADWQLDNEFDMWKYRVTPDWGGQYKHKKWHDLVWQHGALYAGMFEFAKIAEDPRYIEWLLGIANRNNWNLHKRLYHADDHAVGQFYLSLSEIFADPHMRAPTRDRFDTLLKSQKTGKLEHGKDTDWLNRWGWCDALFMAPPVWARLARLTGDSRYLSFMDREYHATYDLLWDKNENLFFRDSSYFTASEKNGKHIFWSRGNGWVFGGLALMIPDLPENWDQKTFYVKLFQEMAAKLKDIQRPDGTWSMGLLGDPQDYPEIETSGSSFFLFGLTWGVNAGYLERGEYEPTIERAWKALAGAVDADGMLGYVQMVAGEPGDSFHNKSEVYAIGAFLAAASQVYRLLGGENVDLKTVVQKIVPLEWANLSGHRTFLENSGWCWFQNPRAIIKDEKLVIGGVEGNGEGNAVVGVYDLANDKPLGKSIVHKKFDRDDHNSPVFYARPDDGLLAVYAKHGTENRHYYRISRPLDFLKWGKERVYGKHAENVTYMNLYKNKNENLLYNFYRGINYNPSFIISKNDGRTWNTPTHFIASEGNEKRRPYAIYALKDSDTIAVCFTDAHPRDFGTSIYYAEFRNGNFYKANGERIKNLQSDGPLKPSEADLVFKGGGGPRRGDDPSALDSGWNSSLAFDSKGRPHVGFSVNVDNEDHRYHLAHWDGNRWIDRQVAYAGTCLYQRESSYTGLISLDPKDPKTVAISTDVNPSDGSKMLGNHQIFTATIQDKQNHETIDWKQITFSPSASHLRPYIVYGDGYRVLLWQQGRFYTYQDYDLDSVGIVTMLKK